MLAVYNLQENSGTSTASIMRPLEPEVEFNVCKKQHQLRQNSSAKHSRHPTDLPDVTDSPCPLGVQAHQNSIHLPVGCRSLAQHV
jgi:hypothetical protein